MMTTTISLDLPAVLPAKADLEKRLAAALEFIDATGMPGEYTAVGWAPPEERLPYFVWFGAVSRLADFAASIRWNLGDMLCYGQIIYGETYSQVADVTGYSVRTLYQSHWVCDSIPMGIRYPPKVVAFSTHIKVAPHRFSLERKKFWLDLCAVERWSGERLAGEIKQHALLVDGKYNHLTRQGKRRGNLIRTDKIGDNRLAGNTKPVGGPGEPHPVQPVSTNQAEEKEATLTCPACGHCIPLQLIEHREVQDDSNRND
jgi:hypothetical protein